MKEERIAVLLCQAKGDAAGSCPCKLCVQTQAGESGEEFYGNGSRVQLLIRLRYMRVCGLLISCQGIFLKSFSDFFSLASNALLCMENAGIFHLLGFNSVPVVVQLLSLVQLFAAPQATTHHSSIPSLSPRICSNSGPLSQGYHLSHPLSPPSPPAFNLSQDQGLFQ